MHLPPAHGCHGSCIRSIHSLGFFGGADDERAASDPVIVCVRTHNTAVHVPVEQPPDRRCLS